MSVLSSFFLPFFSKSHKNLYCDLSQWEVLIHTFFLCWCTTAADKESAAEKLQIGNQNMSLIRRGCYHLPEGTATFAYFWYADIWKKNPCLQKIIIRKFSKMMLCMGGKCEISTGKWQKLNRTKTAKREC